MFKAGLGFFVALSVAAELRSVARPDIGFLLYAAGQILDGARLYVDVVEINPPLIIALNIPPVLLARALGLSDILVYRVGFALALCAALWLAWRALGRALPAEAATLRRLLLVLLAFVLFPLSAQDFGEREHLMLALVLPYVLTAAGRASGRSPARTEALAIGLLAGLGFALKPQFLVLWLGVELHRRLRRTPEAIAVVLVLAAYAPAVVLLTPEYLDLIALVGRQYNRFLYDPFLHLLVTAPGASLVWLSLLTYVALRDRARHPELWTLVAIAVLACFLGGAIQQKGLRYHFYPSFALAIVLLGLAACDLQAPLRSTVQKVYRTVALSLAVTSVLVVSVENLLQVLRFRPGAQELELGELVRVVRERAPGGSIFVMSYHIGSAYPLINYSGVGSASRFGQLWLIAAEYLEELKAPGPLRYHSRDAMSAGERYLIDAVLADMRAHRPELLVVLRHARDIPDNGYRRIDYLDYFGRDPRFQEILDRYERVENVGEHAVYQRLPEGQARTGPRPAAEPGTHDVVRADRQNIQLRLNDPAFLLRVSVLAAVVLVVTFGGRLRRRVAAGP